MKSAEEILIALENEPLGIVSFNKAQDREYIEFIKQIQLDAIKEGMTLAAEIAVTAKVHKAHDKVNYNDWVSSDGGLIKQTILHARDNLKELV